MTQAMNEQDEQLTRKLLQVGYDALTEEEKVQFQEIELKARNLLSAEITPELRSKLESTVPPGTGSFYHGALWGIKQAAEMANNLVAKAEVRDDLTASLPLEVFEVYVRYLAYYSIVLEDKQAEGTDDSSGT